MTKDDILALLSEKLDLIMEARFKRVVRGGKVIRKKVSRPGFKFVRSAGGSFKIKRMSPQEKRNRKLALKRAWKKGKSARVVKAQRKTKRSMLKRKAIIGTGKK